MFAFALKNWKVLAALVAGIAAGFVLSQVTVVPIVQRSSYNSGVTVGEANIKAANADATVQAEKSRAKSDANLRNLSDHDLCVAGLKRRGLPIDQCGSI